MADTDISELEVFDALKVSGVGSPANGTPWIVMKASEGLAGDDNDPDSGQTTSPEADAAEDEMTKAVEALCLLHDYAAKGVVTASELLEVGQFVDGLGKDLAEKAKLKAKQRDALPNSQFAYIDSKGGRHLPIPDVAHVKNALARFDQTHFEDEADKKKAARKIVARAKELGVPVNPKDNAAIAAKMSPGVPAFATETPKIAGKITRGSQSGVEGPMTDGVKHPHSDPSFAEGGESPYNIPAELRVNTNPPSPLQINRPGGQEGEGVIVEKETWELEIVNAPAAKAGNWLAVDNLIPDPTPAETAEPGDPTWETYDADSLDAIARGLAAASRAVNAVAVREATEAIAGNPNDWFDAFDLGCADDEINQALALVARLAYHEAAAEIKKAGRRLSTRTESALRTARDHLTAILGDGDTEKTAGNGAKTSEEDEIMTTVTKEDLAASIAEATKMGFVEALEAQRKLAAKNAKKAAKVAKAEKSAKAKKAAKTEAKKNANNGGDITAEQEEEGIRGKAKADDVDAIPDGGKVDGQYINKSDDEDSSAIKAMADQLSEMRELVTKMASRPRAGGPILDGINRGVYGASEGRQNENVTKSTEELQIEVLSKQLDDAKLDVARNEGPAAEIAKARAAELGNQLTLAKLRQMNLNSFVG